MKKSRYEIGDIVFVSDYKYEDGVINSVEVSNITSNGFTLSVDATSDVGIERYYYIIESENISGTSTINSYTFTTLNSGKLYTVNVLDEDMNGNYSNKYNLNVQTVDNTLATYIKGLYTSHGSNGIYYHTSGLANSATDNSYRYAGASESINNYVCFGTDEETCLEDNLYRIIGVFGNEVKLIKSTSIGTYAWDSGADSGNTWSTSDIKNTLNTTFLYTLSSTWQNKIATYIWFVSGYNTIDVTSETWYNAESSGTTWSGKIGLMYVSDYGFAASPSYWTTNMRYYNSAISNNWMNAGISEWTISPNSSVSYDAFVVNFSGTISGAATGVITGYKVRPTFYLNSDVQYVSGSGTSYDPIRIQ